MNMLRIRTTAITIEMQIMGTEILEKSFIDFFFQVNNFFNFSIALEQVLGKFAHSSLGNNVNIPKII